MFCEGCGSQLGAESAFCSGCGRPKAGPGASGGGGMATQVMAPRRAVISTNEFPVPQSAGSGFSTAGIILGAVAKSKGEEKAVVAMTVAACGTVIGMILGIVVFASI